jgi:hypothetical protein
MNWKREGEDSCGLFHGTTVAFAWKVKVKLSLYLTKHHTMKMYWESGGIAPCILDLSTKWR